jgi:hypothetical protein
MNERAVRFSIGMDLRIELSGNARARRRFPEQPIRLELRHIGPQARHCPVQETSDFQRLQSGIGIYKANR